MTRQESFVVRTQQMVRFNVALNIIPEKERARLGWSLAAAKNLLLETSQNFEWMFCDK